LLRVFVLLLLLLLLLLVVVVVVWLLVLSLLLSLLLLRPPPLLLVVAGKAAPTQPCSPPVYLPLGHWRCCSVTGLRVSAANRRSAASASKPQNRGLYKPQKLISQFTSH
jgi:hypothetical protein